VWHSTALTKQLLTLVDENIGESRKIQRTFAVIAGCFSLLFCRRVCKETRISAAHVGRWLFFRCI